MVASEESNEKVDKNGTPILPEEEPFLDETPKETDVPNGKGPLEGENGNIKPDYGGGTPHAKVRRLSDIALELQGSDEISCGIWCLKGSLMQVFANKKVYVFSYGFVGCIISSSFAYLNGTITTIEKRFKIPSTNTGIIMVGCDISQLCLCLFLNYYGGKGHRPRWMAFGVYTLAAYCLVSALPHFLYGPGENALTLTEEYGSNHDANTTAFLIDKQNRKLVCQSDSLGPECDDNSGNLAPQAILFLAQLISGIGDSLYHSLGVSYMDDNTKRSKTPALVSLSYFLRMLGPAIGYSLASACLTTYISPSLTPTITPSDPRWLGAWWAGWLVISAALLLFASILALFPKSLPRAAARRIQASERRKAGFTADPDDTLEETHSSFKDMINTYLRLLKNKTLMCNNFASVFYFMGYMPYWIFMPKYIETIYKQTAAFASFITGAIGLVCSALGILFAGAFISKVRPSARFLAGWNVVVGAISVLGIISYAFLGCPVNDRQGAILASGQMETTTPCNADCNCEYVKYSPVCSPDGRTFISPCHAGCKDYEITANGSKVYTNCACVPRPPRSLLDSDSNLTLDSLEVLGGALEDPEEPWVLTEGLCPVDCSSHFLIFLVVMCILKFSGGTGRTSNFLVSVRCVDEKDKTVAMGLGLAFLSLFAFIPSPILFGYFIDLCCMVWGKTCSGTGNCWLYNAEMLRYLMNFTAAGFVTIGTMFDFGVWYYVKHLKIFDEEVELEIAPQRQKTQRK
ncbi:solute carrier organic anion transporter family member 74D-like isoform X1 [Macrosteles quadrilineatus]|uniref:solute carrier organic anion transporter family member 74D-like isoform X1 n=1 Tax=Macrosteles quadrilineatus TaxID=74068 RepID=UPI0023E33A94|nr:solute carrier organic anion transporter family member 74D-like isoform X1 [Macrosteles quadrilineatus]XP_054269030.1 solute carrier organic anion transporter family member 74D-like isoform X1 [Macrosteles quadrilineatus]